MRPIAILALALVVCAPALAAEPSGCDKFAWPLDAERHLLASADKQAPGAAALDRATPKAIEMKLLPAAEAKLPMPPEKAPKTTNSFAGVVGFTAAPKPGTYKITLSDAAWIDVVQGGHYVKSIAHSGAVDCAGVRKTVKFEIGAEPFSVQLSGAAASSIAIVITPVN